MAEKKTSPTIPVRQLDIPLNRDLFLRSMLRELSGVLEAMVGVEDASGFVSIVGQNIGIHINNEYRQALTVDSLSRPQVADVLENLKLRIQGDFYVVSQDDEKIVFGNRECPFGNYVEDRPSMCMMTSNVFGTIAAENLGYAKVQIKEAIANRDKECRIVVYVAQSAQAELVDGREYFSAND